MKIGICGGTFDPFHRGHREPVLSVREAMGWDRVIYVPAFVQPFKQDRQAASAYHRFAMAVLGTEEDARLSVSPRELERGAVSYTVDTLEELRREYPEATLDWIVGDDNVGALLEWRSIDRIFELANFTVLSREHDRAGAAASGLPEALAGRVAGEADGRGPHGAIVFARNGAVRVSATEVRRRARAGEPISDLVGPRISRYIDRYGLYRKGNW